MKTNQFAYLLRLVWVVAIWIYQMPLLATFIFHTIIGYWSRFPGFYHVFLQKEPKEKKQKEPRIPVCISVFLVP